MTSGPHSITLTGQNTSNSLSTIKCQGTSGFEFRGIQSLNIEYLKFTGCGNVTHGGAIYIRRTDNVHIRGCHFTDNHVVGHTSKGGVLYAYSVGVSIEESFLIITMQMVGTVLVEQSMSGLAISTVLMINI